MFFASQHDPNRSFAIKRIYSRLFFNLDIIRGFEIDRTNIASEVLQEHSHLTDK